jgi:hypothetical protein
VYEQHVPVGPDAVARPGLIDPCVIQQPMPLKADDATGVVLAVLVVG